LLQSFPAMLAQVAGGVRRGQGLVAGGVIPQLSASGGPSSLLFCGTCAGYRHFAPVFFHHSSAIFRPSRPSRPDFWLFQARN
jgi:hypothetical protein